jgi:hypothetical protein
MMALLGLVFTLVSAGYAGGNRMKINIPFDFTVGTKSLPAGHYTVERISGSYASLVIRNTEQKESVYTLTYGGKSVKAETTGRLEFHRYGDTYFLAEVCEEGGDTTRQLPESPAERDWRKRRSHLADTAKLEIITITTQIAN